MRPTLTTRDLGIERLIASLPFAPPDPDDLRRWTTQVTGQAGMFQVTKAKERSLNRLADTGRARR